MTKNIDQKIDELRELSRNIDKLFAVGNRVESDELLKRALQESVDVEAYSLFFKGESAGYLEKDNKKQETLFRKAIDIRSDDYFLSRNLGICFSNQGNDEEAIKWYDKALKENPTDIFSMRQRGIALTNLGREAEAIEWYDKALKENPSDIDTLKIKGHLIVDPSFRTIV